MPRYIDADALKDDIAVLFERNEKLIDEWLANCVDDVIDEQPTADVVEVVRCKECRHRPYKDEDGEVWPKSWDDETCPCTCEDSYYNWMPEDDFFCKRGERREDDNDREQ